MLKKEDSEIVERCLFSEPGAWEEFVRAYSDLIWRAIRRTFARYNYPYGKEEAEDLFNSVFVALFEDDFRRLRQFRGDNNCSLSTWLAVVTGRRTIDFLRKDKERFTIASGEDTDIFDALADQRPRADIVLERKEIAGIVLEELGLLPARDRLIFQLLFKKGSTVEETASILGISRDLVHSRKYRIVERLKKKLGHM